MPGILVGVDGSDPSRRALEWALREAAHHNAPLTVMTVHPGPVRPATQIYWDVPSLPEDSRNLEHIRTAVREFVDKVTHHAACPVVVVPGTSDTLLPRSAGAG